MGERTQDLRIPAPQCLVVLSLAVPRTVLDCTYFPSRVFSGPAVHRRAVPSRAFSSSSVPRRAVSSHAVHIPSVPILVGLAVLSLACCPWPCCL
jgi:hypothetical protein